MLDQHRFGPFQECRLATLRDSDGVAVGISVTVSPTGLAPATISARWRATPW
jgi:hypothetical protein